MADMTRIEIDLDVHRAIEAGRLTFGEGPNAILRRLLAIDPKPARPVGDPPRRTPRSSGAYSIVLGDDRIEANSLKELLRRAILRREKLVPGFIARLAREATPKGRHIVAATPDGLYPRSPHLTEFAERLDASWWFDTNVGRRQATSSLRTIAHLAALPHLPVIHKRAEKSAMTLEDLGL